MSFAHGANDVANAVGPFAALYGIYQYGYISPKSTVEPWMLAGIGATGEGDLSWLAGLMKTKFPMAVTASGSALV
jgi:phosphate/sulfate permease